MERLLYGSNTLFAEKVGGEKRLVPSSLQRKGVMNITFRGLDRHTNFKSHSVGQFIS